MWAVSVLVLVGWSRQLGIEPPTQEHGMSWTITNMNPLDSSSDIEYSVGSGVAEEGSSLPYLPKVLIT